MAMDIRKAALKDLPALLGLWREFVLEHNSIILANKKDISPLRIIKKNAAAVKRGILRKHLASANSLVLLAEVDGVPAGYAIAYVRKDELPVYTVDKTGDVLNLFVRKPFRRMRLATVLKERCLAFFRKKNIKYISIIVNTHNPPAHAIYKKWGFFDYYIDMRRKL